MRYPNRVIAYAHNIHDEKLIGSKMGEIRLIAEEGNPTEEALTKTGNFRTSFQNEVTCQRFPPDFVRDVALVPES